MERPAGKMYQSIKRNFKRRKLNKSYKRNCSQKTGIVRVKVSLWQLPVLLFWRVNTIIKKVKVNYIFQFTKIRSGYHSKPFTASLRRKALLKNANFRLNRIYLLYLRPSVNVLKPVNYKLEGTTAKHSKRITRKKNCRQYIPKMKAYAVPDPWTNKNRKIVKEVLCDNCGK